MTTICLTMIVKNEEARIERCLESVIPYVDDALIDDTGSSDNTIQIISQFSKHFRIRLARSTWSDFAWNRNIALQLAIGQGTDYVLLLDADHELVVGDPDFRSLLTAPAYNVWQEDHGCEYTNIRLLRADVAAKYVGVTHEVLVLPEGLKAETLPREVIRIVDHADGANRKNKFQRDIDLLRAQLAIDPCDARACYYMAQSYRDMGEFGMALAWYEERMRLGGWEEEMWHAQYQWARMTEHLNWTTQEVTHAYLMAYARRPWRAEPLWHLSRYWRNRNELALANMFLKGANRAAGLFSLGFPQHADVLFLENDCYRNPDD